MKKAGNLRKRNLHKIGSRLWIAECHSERSEESVCGLGQILRFAQNGIRWLAL
jgi:hypothetical protein